LTLYKVLWTGRVSDDMIELLTPIVRAYEAAKLSSGGPVRAAGAIRTTVR
jgi:hypothetical protein